MGSLFSFIFTFLGAALFDILGGVPFLPLQVLWINFTFEIFLSIGLGMGNPTPGLMERPPRKAGERILPTRLFTRLIIAGVVIAACTLGVMSYAVNNAHVSVEVARTMGITTFSFASIFFALETNDEQRSVFNHITLESHRLLQMCGWSLLATFLMIVPDFVHRIFGTADLNVGQWLICIVAGSLILWVTEIQKIFRRRAVESTNTEIVTESRAQIVS
jgi:Ca2+-transporting ATPase